MQNIYRLILLVVVINSYIIASMPESFANPDINYLDKDNLLLQTNISSSIEIIRESDKSMINTVKVDLLLFPKDTVNQEVITLEPYPAPEIKEEYIRYIWEKPEDDKSPFGLASIVRVLNRKIKVTNKVKYPLMNIPDNIMIYTKPAKSIDSDRDDIKSISYGIANDEDDLYKLTHNIASWVKNNINYSLDSLTEDAVQKPSWVLANKYGVCDELTALFIAMMRSLGVPARYISGVAYTNWNNINDFGPHAWAEVYFPDYGWIPYDITYGQFGFIDPTHIVLKISEDSDSTSTKYEWTGKDVNLNTERLSINTALLGYGREIKPDISLSIKSAKENIRPGSYNLIEGIIKNTMHYYVTTEISLANTNDIEILGDNGILEDNTKNIVLEPEEEKTVYWIIKTSEDLDMDYIYTFPLEIYTATNISAKTTFSSSANDPLYSKAEIENEMRLKQRREKRQAASNLKLVCNSAKSAYYIDELADIKCMIENNGDIAARDLSVCIVDSCRIIDINAKESSGVILPIAFTTTGKKEFLVSAANNDALESFYLNLDIQEMPRINLTELSYPSNVEYIDNFDITFTLEKVSIPKNVTVSFSHKFEEKEWFIESFNNNRILSIRTSGRNLDIGNNEFAIKINYTDDNGEAYSYKKEFTISLINITFTQRVTVYLKKVGMEIEKILRSGAKIFYG